MAARILALLALAVAVVSAQSTATIQYLPVNVFDVDAQEATDGLVFYFESPGAGSANITVEAVSHGKPTQSTQVIDTDRVHGDRLVFSMLIDPGSRHELARIVVSIGGAVYTLERPRSGVQYALAAPRRHRH